MAFQFKGDLLVGRAIYMGNVTSAQRAVFTPSVSGAIVYDSDVNTLFFWDGTKWTDMVNNNPFHVAATPPTPTDDSSAGFTEGFIWVDNANFEAYVCVDATVGNAIWNRITASNRVFLTNTAVAPATAGSPTTTEIMAAAGSLSDTIVHYNGTDIETNEPTHVWHVDKSGNYTMLRSPVSVSPGLTTTLVNAAGTSTIGTREILTGTTNYTRTLPAATNVGDYLEFLIPAGQGAKTVAAQTGESINGVSGGTFVMNIESATYRATVSGTGAWEVERLGSPTTRRLLSRVRAFMVSATSVNVNSYIPLRPESATGDPIMPANTYFYLKTGRRYWVYYHFRAKHTSPSFVGIGPYDVTSNTYLYNPTTISFNTSATSSYNDMDSAAGGMLLEPVIDFTMAFRIYNAGSNPITIDNFGTHVEVVELPKYIYE
ncbi:MAG: hypothetical protein D6698_02350 [Gammaproteobacteria bacterium]|nr:MAG: hypothetical protein D6698_02350 [Gammaproteobacteria bacterium]